MTFLHQASMVDPDAIKQLKYAAALPGMVRCVGMPDLHPGGKYPVGASFVSEKVHPELVGQDIGCGMTLYELDCAAGVSDRQMEKMCKTLRQSGLDVGGGNVPEITSPVKAYEAAVNKLLGKHHPVFGTIGGGNHFAEFQTVEKVHEQVQEEGILDDTKLHLLVHSGSRSLGEQVLRDFREEMTGKDGTAGKALEKYLALHDVAVSWARKNRERIAESAADACRIRVKRKILDICHNSVVPYTSDAQASTYVHRKGAAPTDCGLVAIPGSRGTMTYIVRPTPDASAQEAAGWSIAHGAGRVIGRKDLQRKLDKRYPTKEACEKALAVTDLGGRVVYKDEKILRQEAPQAYKDIDDVVADLVARGLVSVVAVMRPLITCKL